MGLPTARPSPSRRPPRNWRLGHTRTVLVYVDGEMSAPTRECLVFNRHPIDVRRDKKVLESVYVRSCPRQAEVVLRSGSLVTECHRVRLSGANTASPNCAACALPMFTLPALPIRIHRSGAVVRQEPQRRTLRSLDRKVHRYLDRIFRSRRSSHWTAWVVWHSTECCHSHAGAPAGWPCDAHVSFGFKNRDGTKLAVASNFAKKSSASGVMAAAAAARNSWKPRLEDGEVAVAEVNGH